VAIHPLLQHSAFGQEDIDRMVKAYEDALRVLRIDDRSDTITEKIAKKIIEVAQTGERNPMQLRNRALKDLGLKDLYRKASDLKDLGLEDSDLKDSDLPPR
jgi:hypothetical protein